MTARAGGESDLFTCSHYLLPPTLPNPPQPPHSSALEEQLQHIKASISDEDVLAQEMDAKLVRQEEFLKR